MNMLQEIDFLRDHELVALLGVIKLVRKGLSSVVIKYVFEEYKKMCRLYAITSHNKSSFRRHLRTLTDMDLISFIHRKKRKCLEILLSGTILAQLLKVIIEKKLIK